MLSGITKYIETDRSCQWVRGTGNGVLLFNGYIEFHFRKMKVLEMDSSDAYTNELCVLKMTKPVNFMLHIFCHNF